jgi:ADP-heptose:LPS heptosyltransferase
VISLRDRLTPQNNLAVQTAVLARSRGFVGTCGGLAWLAPMLGIDTVAVYAEDRFLLSHIFFATQVYRQMGAARFDVVDLRAAMSLDLFSSARAAEEVRQ